MSAGAIETDPGSYLHVLGHAFRKHYSEQTDEWTADAAMRCVPALVHRELGLAPSGRALDIGCGSGSDVRYLSEIVESVVGIDIVAHPAWAAIAAERGPRVRFEVDDFLSYEPVDDHDLILDNGCFHHQHGEARVPYLRKAGLMLAPDGWLVLSTFKNSAVEDYVDDNGRIHRYFTDDELQREISAAGLQVVRQLEVRRARRRGYYRLSFCRRQA